MSAGVVPLRERLEASQAADPDLIDLFGALLDSAAALKAAGETIFHHDRNSRAHGQGGRADAAALAKARRAAEKAIAALDAFENAEDQARSAEDRLLEDGPNVWLGG